MCRMRNLAKQSVSVLLATSVFACPLICYSGHAVARAGGKPVASCCCHSAANAPPAGDHSRGNPSRSQGPKCGCQGICGGAVVENDTAHNLTLDTTWSLPVAVIAPLLLARLEETRFNRFCATPWPDDGMNRGRALCCLYCTFLC